MGVVINFSHLLRTGMLPWREKPAFRARTVTWYQLCSTSACRAVHVNHFWVLLHCLKCIITYKSCNLRQQCTFFYYQNHVYWNSQLNVYYQTITTYAFVFTQHVDFQLHHLWDEYCLSKGPSCYLRHIWHVNCACVHLCVSTVDEQMFMLMRRALGAWLALL